ncbi:transcriptional regulator [Caldovatus sediminis]|uniref:Transcriptional regulator n=1 Tax=Caldovatus sediminis TaxID=2041189 RepID=A0A8J2ZCI5_9PROT|nr:LysR family transcriptional regulator [Caldovatus sediminis]GGG39676.1 transcriptional regulator [Caldovatus sediminis]
MFDWDDLKFFLEVARQGRLGPAARQLRVDIATVSRRVAELERAFGTKLFERTAEGFELTAAARHLLPHAEAIEAHTRAMAEAAGPGRRASGRVRLATMEGIASQYLARRLPALRETHPDLLVELVTSPALFNLTRREADISLSFVPVSGARLRMRQVGAFSLFLYAAPAYLKRHGSPRTRADLAQHAFVDYVEDLVQIREVHWLLDVVAEPRVVFRSSSMFAQQTAAAAGAGLVLLPSFAGETDRRLVPVLKPEVTIQRPIFLACHEDLADLPRVQALTRFLEATIAADTAFLLKGGPLAPAGAQDVWPDPRAPALPDLGPSRNNAERRSTA